MTAGSSTSGVRSPGMTISVWSPLRSHLLPAALHLRRRGVGDRRELVAEAARVAGVDRALGQRVGLAAEAADALDAADEAGA